MTTDTTTSAVERLLDGWDDLKDNIPSDGHAAAESLWDYGDKLADALAAENARLRAASAAGWIAGRDHVNGYLQRVGIAGDGEGDPLADCIRALTPPADDKAALDAMIAEARRDDLARIISLRSGIAHAAAMVSEHCEQYLDSDEPDAERDNLRHIDHHLQGTLIEDDDAILAAIQKDQDQ